MSRQSTPFPITTIGIEIGKNTFHMVGLDQGENIVLQSPVRAIDQKLAIHGGNSSMFLCPRVRVRAS